MDWAAYYEWDPFGNERDDARIGELTALTYNINRKKGARAAKPEDFVIGKRDGRSIKQSVDQIKANMSVIAAAFNAKAKIKKVKNAHRS